MVDVPEPKLTGGPAWFRAIRDVLLAEDVLPPDREANRARKTYCQRTGESLDIYLSMVNGLMAKARNKSEFWLTLHKTTHEAWELSRLKEILCEKWEETIPPTALTEAARRRTKELQEARASLRKLSRPPEEPPIPA